MEAAAQAWIDFCAIGFPYGLRPCGFHAANSLRIESGYILFASELTQPVTPYQLGLERFVDLHAYAFNGSGALRMLRGQSPAQTLKGITIDCETTAFLGKSNQRAHAQITSQCYSPIFERVLGFAFVDSSHARLGTTVYTENGCRSHVARLPFYDPPRFLPRHTPSN